MKMVSIYDLLTSKIQKIDVKIISDNTYLKADDVGIIADTHFGYILFKNEFQILPQNDMKFTISL